MSKNLSKVRAAAFKNQAGRCCYCDFPLLTHVDRDSVAPFGIAEAVAKRLLCTAEHLVPKSCKGPSSRANIAAACLFCNQTRHKAKRVKSPENFKAYVQGRISSGRWHPQELRRALPRLSQPAA
jgi:5-methylcytosine-specific restriction endonuclease McrA